MSKFGSSQSTMGRFMRKKSQESILDDIDPDVSIVKVVSPKKQTKWVSSSFDDFADFLPSKPACTLSEPSQSQTKKRPRETTNIEPVHRLPTTVKGKEKKLKIGSRGDLWADRYKPQNKGELAVHKKKVEDVETWLTDRTRGTSKHQAPILLLTGPAGVGKTATVQTLCEELTLEVQEWANPVQSSYNSDQLMPSSSTFDKSRMDMGYSDSQLNQFKNFLLRANKYSSLQIGGSCSFSRKIIFIEELPNLFFRDSATFHDILRKYRHVGRCPLVFIISDTTSGESNERLLFPAHLQDELQIESVSFNPVAPTMMVKVLTRIATTECHQRGISAVPSSQVLETIAMSSAGDVRSAVNALQFACKQDTYDLKKKCTVKQSGVKKSGSNSGKRLKYELSQKSDTVGGSSIGARDTSCFLFHAIGKVLYCKRGDPRETPDLCRLPPHLQEHDRDPLLLNPEEVVEKSHLSGNYFASFLHQNYVDFYSNVDDLVRASNYFSDADFFTADWTSRQSMESYAASIATRGVIHSNSQISRHDSKRQGVGWKPIHKSQWFGVKKQAQRNVDSACALFKGYHWEPSVLCSELVPYINLINITLQRPGQISFVQEMCRFSKLGSSNRGLERLDEKDVLEESSADQAAVGGTRQGDTQRGEGEEVTLSQKQVKAPEAEDVVEEEVVIEDYDDEEYEELFNSDDSFT